MRIPRDKNSISYKHPVSKRNSAPGPPVDRVKISGEKADVLGSRMKKLEQLSRSRKTFKHRDYSLPGKFFWDAWYVQDDNPDSPGYYMYHLDAPKSKNPDDRHLNARIRAAYSTDLDDWHDLGEVFGPGPEGSWDDKVIWSGNVYRKENGEYVFFYTGLNQRDGDMQRIGVARSKDGVHWERPEKPLLEPDGRWYETTEKSPVVKAWRDPVIVRDKKSGKYVMLFTAKTKDGDKRYKGCIGMAVSDKLDGEYKVMPPILAPGRYAQMEVPQVIQKNGKVYLFFSSMEKDYNPKWAKKIGGPQTGLHCYVADSFEEPFKPVNGDGVITGTKDNLYTVKLLKNPENPSEYVALGWYMRDEKGKKAFSLSQPLKVKWDGDNISIDTSKK